MMTREYALTNEIMRIIDLELGFRVYDHKPMNEVGYPFVEVETVAYSPHANKTNVLGTVEVIVSVWGLQNKHKQVSNMTNAIYDACHRINYIRPYNYSIRDNQSFIDMMGDESTQTPLKRGRITMVFNLN